MNSIILFLKFQTNFYTLLVMKPPKLIKAPVYKPGTVKFEVRRSMVFDNNNKIVKGWQVGFTVGVQSFYLAPVGTKESAEWHVKMLRIAFNNFAGKDPK